MLLEPALAFARTTSRLMLRSEFFVARISAPPLRIPLVPIGCYPRPVRLALLLPEYGILRTSSCHIFALIAPLLLFRVFLIHDQSFPIGDACRLAAVDAARRRRRGYGSIQLRAGQGRDIDAAALQERPRKRLASPAAQIRIDDRG